MCGICGIVNLQQPRNLSGEVLKINTLLKHRGPDGEGYVLMNDDCSMSVAGGDDSAPALDLQHVSTLTNDHVAAFGHRRLSIMDLSQDSHQPFSKNGTDWLMFNGAIYNFKSLRSKMESAGHSFSTSGDTEVLWQALLSYRTDCLSMLNGMFAIAWWNSQSGRLILARDRTGVKPLYYSMARGKHFVFASELKAVALAGYHRGINKRSAFTFLTMGLLEYDDESLFKGIFELKPGTMVVFDRCSQVAETKRYHTPDYYPFYSGSRNYREIVNGCAERITSSIESHLVSAVPIGTCLSGGLDSSTICAVARNSGAKSISTDAFTATFPGMTEDEGKFAGIIAGQYGLDWKTATPDAEGISSDLEELVYSQDLPLVSTGTYAQHSVMQLASEHGVKVLLDGQGADELFGGYYRYIPPLWNMMFAQFHYKALIKSVKSFGDIFPLKQAVACFVRHGLVARLPNRMRFAAEQMLHRELRYLSRDVIAENRDSFKGADALVSDNLNTHLFYDYFKGPLKNLLRCEDRASMHFGIESRTPFADDIHLQDYVFNVQASCKMRNGWTKSLLRDAMKNILPDDIRLRRDKKGYQTPHSSWLAALIKNSAAYFELMSDRGITSIQLLDSVKNMGDVPILNERLFRFITFGVWIKAFNL